MSKFIWTIKNKLARVLNPTLWVQVRRIRDYEFDRLVRAEMASKTLQPANELDLLTARFSNGATIWTGNYPYGYGSFYTDASGKFSFNSVHFDAAPAVGETTLPRLRRYLADQIASGNVYDPIP